MKQLQEQVAELLNEALGALQSRRDVYTFGIYLDHESGEMAVLADTAENSQRMVHQTNAYARQHWRNAVEEGNLASAELWQANAGRSFSLGDYAYQDLARRPVDLAEPDLELSLIRAVMAVETQIFRHCEAPKDLVLFCSTLDDELGLIWSVVDG